MNLDDVIDVTDEIDDEELFLIIVVMYINEDDECQKIYDDINDDGEMVLFDEVEDELDEIDNELVVDIIECDEPEYCIIILIEVIVMLRDDDEPTVSELSIDEDDEVDTEILIFEIDVTPLLAEVDEDEVRVIMLDEAENLE